MSDSEKKWAEAYYRCRQRCNNPKFWRFERYGGRGIKCLMSKEDFKTLWFRDKAFNLKHPSIDRIDNDGHYSLDNCRYIELTENSRKRDKENSDFCINGHEMKEGNFDLRGGKHRRCLLCRKTQDAGRGKYEFMVKGKSDKKCPICGKVFKSKKGLLCHIANYQSRGRSCVAEWDGIK